MVGEETILSVAEREIRNDSQKQIHNYQPGAALTSDIVVSLRMNCFAILLFKVSIDAATVPIKILRLNNSPPDLQINRATERTRKAGKPL